MRLRRREAPQLGVLGALALAATLLSVAAGAGGASHERRSPRGLGVARPRRQPRQQVAVGQRVIVVLNSPSLADRVAAAGGTGERGPATAVDCVGAGRGQPADHASGAGGREDSPRAPVRPRAHRLLCAARSASGRFARAGSGGGRCVPGPHRLSSLGVVHADREREARRRVRARGRTSPSRASTAAE